MKHIIASVRVQRCKSCDSIFGGANDFVHDGNGSLAIIQKNITQNITATETYNPTNHMNNIFHQLECNEKNNSNVDFVYNETFDRQLQQKTGTQK